MNPPTKINLTLPVTDSSGKGDKNKSRSPSPSPTQKRKHIFSHLLPQNNTGSATGNPKNKCALKPGHSLMDWIRLGSSGCDLSGTKGIITPVSHAELAKHCKKNDAWLAIRGKVYNVTQYMDFHPGGEDELIRGIGKDATKLFDEVHAWVNYEQLLSKCFIGPLRNVTTINLDITSGSSKSATTSPSKSLTSNGGFKLPFTSLPSSQTTSPTLPQLENQPSSSLLTAAETSEVATTSGSSFSLNQRQDTEKIEIIPRFDWIQKTSDLTIVFYTKPLCNPGLIVEYLNDNEIDIRVSIERTTHLCNFKLANDVRWPCSVRVSIETGKIEITFTKSEPTLWTTFGLLERKKLSEFEIQQIDYDVISRQQITHDSYALVLKPKGRILQIHPIGYHVSITCRIQGSESTRSYTPIPSSYLPVPCPSASCIALLVKSYTTGIISKYISRQNPLASGLKVSQPKGGFSIHKLRNHSKIALLAAGSGITPFLAIVDYLLDRSNNRMEIIKMFYFNKTDEDIWCRQKLDSIAKRDKRFTITHVLSQPQESWSGMVGHISSEITNELHDEANINNVSFCCICGPMPFNELAVKLLKESGFSESNYHCFQG